MLSEEVHNNHIELYWQHHIPTTWDKAVASEVQAHMDYLKSLGDKEAAEALHSGLTTQYT